MMTIFKICCIISFFYMNVCDGFLLDKIPNIISSGSFDTVLQMWKKSLILSETLKADHELSVRLANSVPMILKKWYKESAGNTNTSFFKRIFNEIKDIMIHRQTELDIDDKNVGFHVKYPKKRSGTTVEDFSDIKGQIFFIIHGWYEDINDTHWYDNLTKKLGKVYPDCTVVQVDWGHYANKNIYALAAINSRRIGNVIAGRLIKMVKKNGFPLSDIVLIGFSLGAQVSGQVGKRFLEITKSKLPKIIALDPAGPLFEGISNDQRLDPSDADQVLVIHTDTDMCGYKGPCGTIDFYPNGGFQQPGCKHANMFCNHMRAPDLFAEAILDPKEYAASKCDTYEEFKQRKCVKSDVFFGDIDVREKGKFYFATTARAPFHEKVRAIWKVLG